MLRPRKSQATTVSGTRRRAASAWLAGEIHFLKITPPVIVLKAVYFLIQILKRIENICLLDNQVVNDLRRHTRDYVKSIGGLPIIPDLPRREYKKKDHPILEDSVLVGYLEELVEEALQEVVQPLNQVGPNTPYCSPVHTHVPSPPHSPPRLIACVNEN